jgi:hypothetical protein
MMIKWIVEHGAYIKPAAIFGAAIWSDALAEWWPVFRFYAPA